MNMKPNGKARVILRGVGQSLHRTVEECLELCDWEKQVSKDDIVVLKPNLCTSIPSKVEGSNTDPDVTAALCEILLKRTSRIFIVEANGLRHRAQEAFEASRL